MSLFDQQPFGPIPARKPMRFAPDPELEAIGVDPDATEIEVLEPRPAELVDPVIRPRNHRVRYLIAWLLLAPMLLSLVLSAVGFLQPEVTGDRRMTVPYLISAAIVLATILGAYLIFRRSLRTPKT